MQEAVDGLVKLLDLEPIEVNIFRGLSPDESRQRVFGGQVAGQALVAAARTVQPLSPAAHPQAPAPPPTDRLNRTVHSLHAYFLRPGDPSVPILYEVDRIRDGRSFTTRRVVAIQHGQAIFNLSASFHVAETGLNHQSAVPDDLPDPESLPDFRTRWAEHADDLGMVLDTPRPIDVRPVDWQPADRRRPLPPRQRVWFRADGQLPDDPVLHTCVLTYASDMTLLDTAVLPHGGSYREEELMMASLDHAIWFLRPFRADEWLLYDQDTPSASNALGLARGLVYRQDGTLVAAVVQEGLIRLVGGSA